MGIARVVIRSRKGLVFYLEIDATAVFFPIAKTRGFRTVTPTDFHGEFVCGVVCLLCHWGFSEQIGAGFAKKLFRCRINHIFPYDLSPIHHRAMVSATPMSIKENLPASPVNALSGFSVMSIDGPQAEAFAQAQFMNDVRLLKPGTWQWNGWLTPKGRVIALFALVLNQPGELLVLLPDTPAELIKQRLQAFVFRSKVNLRCREDLIAASFWPSASDPAIEPTHAVRIDQTGLSLDWGSTEHRRYLQLLPANDQTVDAATAENDARWRDVDLKHGLPRLDASQVELWTPQMLSLQRLGAYSVKKGCYPGQEIVARTHFLGQAKRELMALRGVGFHAGQSVFHGTQDIGRLVCASTDQQRALAVLPIDAATFALTTETTTCTLEVLHEGLHRAEALAGAT